MKIFRSILETDLGQFLVDAEHDGGELSLLRIHPIIEETAGECLPLCQFEDAGILVEAVKEAILKIE